MKHEKSRHEEIHLGTHGEDYGSWMSNPVFYMIGGLLALSVVLAVLSFTVFRLPWLGAVFSVAAAAFLALLCWCGWIRKQYAFGGGGMMERTHQCLLAHLGFDGKGTLLDVGCGSGALSIRAALTWPEAQVTGIDYWGVAYGYGQPMCEKNAASEGVATRCRFQHGDAHQLDFPDDTFDAVVSNYVYHNITGADKQALLRETLRVLKPGGVFALNDDMKPPSRWKSRLSPWRSLLRLRYFSRRPKRLSHLSMLPRSFLGTAPCGGSWRSGARDGCGPCTGPSWTRPPARWRAICSPWSARTRWPAASWTTTR